MNNNHNPKTVLINVSYNLKNANISININLSLAELKQIIFSHFQIDTMTYSLYYKNTRIGLSDNRPCYTILGKEKTPRFHVIKKKSMSNDKKTVKEPSASASIVHMSQRSFEPNKSIIRMNKYFNKQNNNSNSSSTKALDSSLPSIAPNSKFNKKLFNPSSNAIKKKNYLFKQKLKQIDNGSAYSSYMSFEERRIKEAYDDKKNWIDKRGFFKSVGSYSMKPLFIPNYVNKTPSETPLNYKFRETKKKKWMDQRGFFVA